MNNFLTLLSFLLFSFVIQNVIPLPYADAINMPQNAQSTYDDLSLFLSKYGKPDVDDSTQYDKPRPPIVTRWLIYKKEKVRVWYVPDASVNAAPPYKKWKFLGFADERTKRPISLDEATKRLQHRLKKSSPN